jgi:hypothetical protein
MRIFFYLPILVLTFLSCETAQKNNSHESETINGTSTIIDSISTQDNNYENIACLDTIDENMIYIGFVNTFYFLDNNEVFIDLYFKNDILTNKEYTEIASLTDTTIYQDEESSRKQLSLDNAKKHLDLRGIDSIFIFDHDNNFVDKAKLKSIEYLDVMLYSYFIATYETSKKLDSKKYYYCIGNQPVSFTSKFKTFDNQQLTDSLVRKFEIDQTHVYKEKAMHFQDVNSKEIISILNSNESVLIFHSDIDYKFIYKSKETENIHGAIIIPVFVNGFPIILLDSYLPETCSQWTNLLIFNGTEYLAIDRQRIKIY